MKIRSWAFWDAALERALATFAQTALAFLGASQLGLFEAPWRAAVSTAAMALVLSVLKSVAATVATGGGPSLTNAEVVAPPDDYTPRHAAPPGPDAPDPTYLDGNPS